jgi:hypothetical protein
MDADECTLRKTENGTSASEIYIQWACVVREKKKKKKITNGS